MTRIKKALGYYWAFVCIALIMATVSISIAQQDSIKLAVSPQVLDTQINPNEKVENTFRLTNGSAEAVKIVAIPKNFTPQGEDGGIDLTEDDTSYSLAKWIEVTPKEATVPANKTQDFKVVIKAPQNAEPGSRFGSVVFATVPELTEGSGAAVSQEIAPVILVTVAGELVEKAEIADFYPTKSIWSNEPEVVLQSRVKNSGNVHFKPKGLVTIKDTFGKEVAKISIEDKNVLPDSIRKIDAKWPLDSLKLGRYKAELTLVYGKDDQIVKSETTFYIIPYQLIIPIAVAVAVILFIVIKFRKRIILAARVLSGKDSTAGGEQ